MSRDTAGSAGTTEGASTTESGLRERLSLTSLPLRHQLGLVGLLALALVQSWGRRLPRWLLLIAAWGTGALLLLHGGDFMIQGAITETGFISLSGPATWTPTHWQTFVWGPWWLLGGLIFCLAAWNYQSRSRDR